MRYIDFYCWGFDGKSVVYSCAVAILSVVVVAVVVVTAVVVVAVVVVVVVIVDVRCRNEGFLLLVMWTHICRESYSCDM